ncbi:hypothetical protein BSL78_12903 [Apostichopus japonicus]|uniref:Uncharacterized protein n=1 Tax=Stichopus japonicus TaxID=307972 RepID=A0A2G8KQE8_STIJA|nr:hypothetical protein BSL78_12903 [Apostichopus japonicus]
MPYSTRSKAKIETVSQFPVVLDQHSSTSRSESQSDIAEITRKLQEVKLFDIKKKKKESNELPPKGSAVTENLKRTGKEGEELQTNTERERDGERRGEQKKVKVEHDKPEASCNPKEEPSDGNLKELSVEKEQPTRQKVMELQGTLDDWKHTVERYKECIAVTSFTLALIDDRSVSSCIADIRKANDLLKEEMEREFANLESPASTKVNKEQEAKTAQNVKQVTITDKTTFCIDFKEYDDKQAAAASPTTPKDGEYLIASITGLSNGEMVISGAAPGKKSHITVINSKGEIQVRHPVEGRPDFKKTHRYCCNFSEQKVLTVYGTKEVAIYDVRKGEVCDSSSAPKRWCMSCVAYDPNNSRYIVCYGTSKAFAIFDNKLKYSCTVRLPNEKFGTVNDFAVHGKFLLVCHQEGAHAITIDGVDIEIKFELKKPTQQDKAIGVCIDKNSFIYMLWSGDENNVLAQYDPHDHKLLDEKNLERNKTGCLTTVEDHRTERLVLAANDNGQFYSFQLRAEYCS